MLNCRPKYEEPKPKGCSSQSIANDPLRGFTIDLGLEAPTHDRVTGGCREHTIQYQRSIVPSAVQKKEKRDKGNEISKRTAKPDEF